jgi:hypothetical protein
MFYDYAQTILDPVNFLTFTRFVDQLFSLKKIGTVYFYGAGSEGKTTLINKMIDSHPSVFGFKESNARVIVYREDSYPECLPAKGEGSIIIVTNVLPDGVHPSRIVFFKKKFKR